MTIKEQVQYFRNELYKARRDFPKHSQDVKVAERNYQVALHGAVLHGSPAVRGSDLSLTDSSSAHVDFYCDEVNVTAVFYSGDETVDSPKVFTRAEAIEVGRRAAETGTYEQFPISGISSIALRGFGQRLKEYGETCRSEIMCLAHCPTCNKTVPATIMKSREEVIPALTRGEQVQAIHIADVDHVWELSEKEKTNLQKMLRQGSI